MTYAPLSLAELRALQIPPRNDLIDGLLPEGQITLFAAREKSGKSLIATDVTCALALEQPFLDRAVRGGTVVFIALEENIREVRNRILERVGPGYDDATVRLFVLPANGFTDATFRLDDAECMQAFHEMITTYDADLVVIDTMREAHQLRENESDDMAALMRPLREMAHATNAAVALLHHESKAGNSRGSTAIAAGADQIWTFERTNKANEGPDGNPAGVLRVEGRFGAPVRLAIRLGDGLRWVLDDDPIGHDLTARERILACLRRHDGGRTAQEIATETGIQLKTTQNEISRLLGEAPPSIVAVGVPTRGNPRRYRIAEHAQHAEPRPWFIIPDSQTLGDRESGTIPGHGSHRSRNDGNDGKSTVPDSHPPNRANGRNDPARCEQCGSRRPENGSRCPFCRPDVVFEEVVF